MVPEGAAAEAPSGPSTPSTRLQAAVWTNAELLSLLLERCAPVPVVSAATGSTALALMESLVRVQEAALTCANNMLLLQLPLPAGSHAQIWRHLCVVCAEEVRRQSRAVPLVLSLIATFVRCPRVGPLGAERAQLEGVLMLAAQAADEEVRVACIEVLGNLRDEPLLAADASIVLTGATHSLAYVRTYTHHVRTYMRMYFIIRTHAHTHKTRAMHALDMFICNSFVHTYTTCMSDYVTSLFFSLLFSHTTACEPTGGPFAVRGRSGTQYHFRYVCRSPSRSLRQLRTSHGTHRASAAATGAFETNQEGDRSERVGAIGRGSY